MLAMRLAPVLYDIGVRFVFSPVGGIDLLREQTLDALKIRPGVSVHELGCGTGALTKMLVDRGAYILGVDQSEGMLRRARRRAPTANLIQADILRFECSQTFDRVLIAFVLHHLTAEARLHTLNLARNALKSSGLVGVLDWTEPDSRALRWAFHGLLMIAEPSSASNWIEKGFDAHLEEAGLVALESRTLAMGVAKVVVAEPSSTSNSSRSP